MLPINAEFSYYDFFAIICGIFLIAWLLILFIDSWKIIKINETFIEEKIFNLKLYSVNWNDIIGFKESRTSQFKNFAQGRIVKLLTNKRKNINISEKHINYEYFIKYYFNEREKVLERIF